LFNIYFGVFLFERFYFGVFLLLVIKKRYKYKIKTLRIIKKRQNITMVEKFNNKSEIIHYFHNGLGHILVIKKR